MLDSRHYMAQACRAYLYRLCIYVAGFGEFGPRTGSRAVMRRDLFVDFHAI